MTKKTNKGKLTQKFSVAAASNSGRVHVVPGIDGWSVKKEGSIRSMLVFKSKKGAVVAATKNVASSGQIVIHGFDGAIAEIRAINASLVLVDRSKRPDKVKASSKGGAGSTRTKRRVTLSERFGVAAKVESINEHSKI